MQEQVKQQHIPVKIYRTGERLMIAAPMAGLEPENILAYSIPHQLLAQRNMQVMNKLGIQVMTQHTNLPGERSWTVVAPTNRLRPFAEHVIRGYLELVSP